MSLAPAHTRRRRVLTSAAAALTAVAGLVAITPPASAHGSSGFVPRTYTATLTSGPIVRDLPTTFALKVTNTTVAPYVSALDRVRVTIPAGWSAVSAVSATAPRGGWTASLSGSTLTAKTKKVTSTLKRTESVTIAFTATAKSSSCTARTDTWALAVDGVLLAYTSQSGPLTTTLGAVANTVSVHSVKDQQDPALDHQAVVNQPFDVTVDFTCGGDPAPAPTTNVELTASAGAGTLTTSPVAAGGQTSTTLTARYSQVTASLPLSVSSVLPPAATQIEIVSDAATKDLNPGDDTTLVVDGATAILQNGANGPVSLIVSPCSVGCPAGAVTPETTLSGNFKDGAEALYDNDDPASVIQTCAAADCTFKGSSFFFSNAYLLTNPFPYNSSLLCFFLLCGPSFSGQAGQSDFTSFPVYVSIVKGGETKPYTLAPRCVAQPSSGASSSAWQRFFTDTGTISNPAARTLGFCVDVNAITRTGNTFTGDLQLPILFVEDPKFIVGR